MVGQQSNLEVLALIYLSCSVTMSSDGFDVSQ